MTIFGLAEPRDTKLDVGFRRGLFRHVGVVLGGAGSAAVVLGGYELLRAEPSRAFGLLQGWGPAFVLGIVALVVMGKFLDGLSAGVRESFSVVAGAVQNQAEASGRTADALTRLANQGGRQAEEIQRLVVYAGREFPSLYTRLDRQDEALERLAHSVERLAASVNALHQRFDRSRDFGGGKE